LRNRTIGSGANVETMNSNQTQLKGIKTRLTTSQKL
jgi:hypothetical protein